MEVTSLAQRGYAPAPRAEVQGRNAYEKGKGSKEVKDQYIPASAAGSTSDDWRWGAI
ncbi:hypothetical protein GGQ84_000724 [Desulfitispora alkaliphila]|uniref:hypothetical protein n=1 Tax=Desulfitispora alkaliphila TaxID=622674 RepID=UPI003D24E48A